MSKKADNARTKIGKAVKKRSPTRSGTLLEEGCKAKSARSAAEKIRKAENKQDAPKKG